MTASDTDVHETFEDFLGRVQRNRRGVVLSGHARVSAWASLGVLSAPYLFWVISWSGWRGGLWFGDDIAVHALSLATHPAVLVVSAVFALVVLVALIGTERNPPNSITWSALALAVVVAGIVALPSAALILVVAANATAFVVAVIATAAVIGFLVWGALLLIVE